MVGDGPDLLHRVERAELGRLGDRDGARLRAVHVAEAPGLGVDEVRGQLAVRRRDGPQLDPRAVLGCTALVDVDMRRRGTEDRLPALGHRLQGDDVCAGAVEHREDLGGGAEVRVHRISQGSGHLVVAVGDLMPGICPREGVEHFRMDAGIVVAGESAP